METIEFNIDWGLHALLKLITDYRTEFGNVLEIGSGAGEHARFFRFFGKEVFAVDLHHDADYVGDFMQVEFGRKFDLIWCSHVLEHQRNVGAFLDRIFDTLADDGILAITVPVHPRSRLVSGHITSWNAGLLCYNLVLAGFDCSRAVLMQQSELSLIVRKCRADGPDIGGAAAFVHIDELARFFPFPVSQGGECEIANVGWQSDYRLPGVGRPCLLRINNRFMAKPVQVMLG